MDRAGTLPLNLYETQTLLNPLDLQFVLPRAQSSVPGKVQNVQKVSLMNSLLLTCTYQRGEYSSSERGDSESDEDCEDDTSGFNMVMLSRAGRQRLITRRMRDFPRFRWSYVCIQTRSVCAFN